MDIEIKTWLFDIKQAIEEIESFSVSDETIWGIVINHLPLLRAEIEKMLVE